MNSYRDIIDHPHYQSKTRPHMSMISRAAQFAPFAALTGYEESVRETERLTEQKAELSEEEIAVLNDKLQYLYMRLPEHPAAGFTYFVKDASKDGGTYETVSGTVRTIDALNGRVILEDGTSIPIPDIIGIEV